MILRFAAFVTAALGALPALAADNPARTPPDRAAMSQFIAGPVEPAAAGAPRGRGVPASKGKRVRYTIPAPKRM